MTFTGLTAGQSYTFTITANNSYGPGTSVTTSSITPIQLPTFTTTPGDTTMLVQFTPTAEVTYTITVKQYEQVAPDWGYTLVQTFPATLTGTPGNYTITGLANFYFYACSINCTQSGNTLSTPFSSAFQNPVLPAPMILKFNNSTTYEIRLPISGNSSNVMVDWGAGVSFRYKENYNFLTGPLPTQYVKIYGSFQNFGNAWDGRDKLLSIDSWGNNPTLTTLQGMCQGATSLTSVPNTIPSSVTNCNAMFSLTTSFTAAGLSNWTATNITDMSYMFERASSTYSNGLFKENLSGWSSTALHVKFFSPDGTLDTSETDPYSPFNPNNIFILEFNAGAITLPVTGTNITVDFGSGYSSSLTGTLSVAGQVKIRGSITAFGNPSTSWTGANLLTRIVSWGTSSITNLSRAFLNATSLTSVPTLLPSTVTNTSYMFSGATAFAATGLNNWFPTNVTNMSYMFYGTSAAYTSTGPTGTFRVDLNGWPGTATSTLFFSPNAATDTTTTDPFSPFNTLYSLVLRINVVNEGGLGLRLADLQLIDPTITIYWGDQYNNVYKQADDKTHYYDKGKYVLRFLGRFRAFIWNQIPGASYCGMSLLTHIVRWSNDLTTISISESTNPATGVLYPGATNPATGVLYPGATNLVYVPPTLPTSARNLNEMFNGATIFNQNLSSWDVTNITSMNSMFRNAAAFTATGLNTWTPTNVTDMSYMFYGTSAAFTNVSSSGRLLTDLTSWPYTASNTLFLSPDRSTDTTLIDIKSPFYGR
jgi:hypothetical protein